MGLKLFPNTRIGRLRLAALILIPLAALGIPISLGISMPGESFSGTPPTLTDAERESARRLRETVEMLSEQIRERNSHRYSALGEAAEYLSGQLEELDLEVTRHGYSIRGREYVNLEAILPGSSNEPDLGCLVLGAHYDSVFGTPGADDNASGTAALVELARLLRDRTFSSELRFVLFANEEPPYFQTDEMGSRVYARLLADGGTDVAAMICLESIGYFTSEPNSQSYPFPFSLLYPDTGDFIGFVGNTSSRALVRRVIAAFRDRAHVPSEGLAAPSIIPGIGWSDHWSFWQEGWPAVMVTDTAPFRNPNYHLPTDRAETLDWETMARIVHGLVAVVEELDREGH